MKKVKTLFAYLVALVCIVSTLLYKQKDVEVFQTTTLASDQLMIYMLDEDRDLVPVTVNVDKKESDEENVHLLIELMGKDFKIDKMIPLIPKAIQCLNIDIENNVVKLNFNEAIFAMNSSYELRFIEGIVSSIVQLNNKFKVEFYANNNPIYSMPLSQMPMTLFDYRLGVNNFELNVADLHDSISRQVVNVKRNEDTEYYVVSTIRVMDDDMLSFVNDVIDETSNELECMKIEYNDNEWVLHLNDKFLLEENVVNQEKVIGLLYTLKMNQFADDYVIKIQDEVVKVDGFDEKITFDDLNLNVFEE